MTPIDPAVYERHALRAEGKPRVTACPTCFMPALTIDPLTRGGLRAWCGNCGLVSFLRRADSAWLLAGLGADLVTAARAETKLRTLRQLRTRLLEAGQELIAAHPWTQARVGREKRITLVLPVTVLCLCCGARTAQVRQDRHHKPYVTCVPGCGSRSFLGTHGVLLRMTGWTTRASELEVTGWMRHGRSVWEGWHDHGLPSLAAPIIGVTETEIRQSRHTESS